MLWYTENHYGERPSPPPHPSCVYWGAITAQLLSAITCRVRAVSIGTRVSGKCNRLAAFPVAGSSKKFRAPRARARLPLSRDIGKYQAAAVAFRDVVVRLVRITDRARRSVSPLYRISHFACSLHVTSDYFPVTKCILYRYPGVNSLFNSPIAFTKRNLITR